MKMAKDVPGTLRVAGRGSSTTPSLAQRVQGLLSVVPNALVGPKRPYPAIVLIDFENLFGGIKQYHEALPYLRPRSLIRILERSLAALGGGQSAHACVVFADWTRSGSLHAWRREAEAAGIICVDARDQQASRNGLDRVLVAEAVQLVHSVPMATVFALVTGDNGFSSLAVHLRMQGKIVVHLAPLPPTGAMGLSAWCHAAHVLSTPRDSLTHEGHAEHIVRFWLRSGLPSMVSLAPEDFASASCLVVAKLETPLRMGNLVSELASCCGSSISPDDALGFLMSLVSIGIICAAPGYPLRERECRLAHGIVTADQVRMQYWRAARRKVLRMLHAECPDAPGGPADNPAVWSKRREVFERGLRRLAGFDLSEQDPLPGLRLPPAQRQQLAD
jgi:hypothetical protein